jgi:hypothetical protein
VSPHTDPWHCEACSGSADLIGHSVALGLIRAAVQGTDRLSLGSHGIEPWVADLLLPCGCGGRLMPGAGGGPVVEAGFDQGRLSPLLEAGWEALCASADEPAVRLRELWRPHAMVLLGRSAELAKEQMLQLRLEEKLNRLAAEVERATAAGEPDVAEAAHARYIELGTTYVRRFVRQDDSDERAPA